MTKNIQELLEKLGLTEYEAKTLNSLFKLQESKAPEISRDAQVPKTRVYDVLDRLVTKKLVIEIQGRPKKYRSIEAEKALKSLVEGKKIELEMLEKQAMELKDFLNVNSANEDFGEKVMKVKDKNDFARILAQELQKANSSIFAFVETSSNHSSFKKTISEAKKNKVDVKIIHSMPEIINNLKKEGINAKHLNHGLEAFVIDNEKLILALSDFSKEKGDYHFTIWKSQPMIDAMTSHFNSSWAKAK